MMQPLITTKGLSPLCALRALLTESSVPSHDSNWCQTDWEVVATLLSHHGLGPAVFSRMVHGFCGKSVLLPWLHLFKQEFTATAIMNHKVHVDVVPILDVLIHAGVEVIGLKGLHLFAAGYVPRGTRRMSDIDLLVQPQQIWRAWTALRESGFVTPHDISEHQVARFPLHLPRLMKSGSTPVELHRAITPPLLQTRISMKGLWERSSSLSMGPHAISALSPEDLLLHLCMHATHQHRCQVPLRSIYDIALVVDRTPDGVEWDTMLRISRALGTNRPLFCGLLLAAQVFGASVPRSVFISLVPEEDHAHILSCALKTVLSFDIPAGPLARYRAGVGAPPQRMFRAARELFSSPKTIAQTTDRGSVFRRLGVYWELFSKVIARNREFAARLARNDPEALAEMRVAQSVVAIETWMAE